jgi:F-type H+-transporting ATPase subunit b
MIASRHGKRIFALVVACALLSVIFFIGLGFGAEEAGHGGAHDSGRTLDLLYRFINFALLVIILFVVLRKAAVKDFFSARREEIKEKLDGLRRDKETAEARYQELEKKIKEFEKQRKEIIEQFKAEGIAEKEKIIAEARARVDQILAQADLTIQREIQGARNRLRMEVVEVAAEKAQEIIAREIKDSDQEQLVNDFIEKIKKVEKLH